MALFSAAQVEAKTFVGELTATEHSGSVGSLTKQVGDYILTLDSTNHANIAVTSTALGYGTKVAITVVATK